MDVPSGIHRYTGTFRFAVSGAFAAMEKKFDPFGVLIPAFITAVGGGTVRDLHIGDALVSWLQQSISGCVTIAGTAGALFFPLF